MAYAIGVSVVLVLYIFSFEYFRVSFGLAFWDAVIAAPFGVFIFTGILVSAPVWLPIYLVSLLARWFWKRIHI